MHDLFHGVLEDFSDLHTPGEALRITVRLLLAAVLGGVLGFERERSGKSAGMRTHMLVAIACGFFVLVPQQFGMSNADLSRVVQGIVTGIGFIGAGSILKLSQSHEVRGLTTAAGLFLTSAIGMAAGMGRAASAIQGTILAYTVLALLQPLERKLLGEESTHHHKA